MLKKFGIILAAFSLSANLPAFAQDTCEDYECKLDRVAAVCLENAETTGTAAVECFDALYDKHACSKFEGFANISCTLAARVIANDLGSNTYQVEKNTDWTKPADKQRDNFVAIEKIGQSETEDSTHELSVVCNETKLMIAYGTSNADSFFKSNKMSDDSTVTASFGSGPTIDIPWQSAGEDTLVLLNPKSPQSFIDQLRNSEEFSITTNTKSGSNRVNFETENFEAAFKDLGQCAF